MHPRENRIKIEDCQQGKLYKLHARNIKIGVYKREPAHNGGEWFHFYGIRTKFGSRFIDAENHWDAPEFATCSPLEEIGDCPEGIAVEYGSKELFEWLDAKEKELGLSDEAHEKWKLEAFQAELDERKKNRNQK